MNHQQSQPNKRNSTRDQVKVTLRRVCILLSVTFLVTLPSLLYQFSIGQATPVHASVRSQAWLRDTSTFPPDGWTSVFTDSLTASSNDWSNGALPDGRGSCGFAPSSYDVISSSSPNITYCYFTKYSFSNFAFEVTMQVATADEGGIFIDNNQGSWYVFSIHNNGAGQNGSYTLFSGSSNDNHTQIIPSTPLSIDPTQANNQIEILVQNGMLSLYVNQQQQGSAQQVSFTSGWVGLIAGTSSSNPSGDVLYNNAQVWLASGSTPTQSGIAPDAHSGTGSGGGQ